jgi:putative ABC transport system permease protein
MNAHPPVIARWLMSIATEQSERDYLVADLDELYSARRLERGRWRANVWYWKQVARSVPLLVARRLQSGRATSHDYGNMAETSTTNASERLSSFAYHLRHAFRRLLREPAFTIAAVATLAFGVGGNVAVFAVVEAVLLRPLPYPAADRLVILSHRDQRTGIAKEFIPTADYLEMVKRQSSFDAFGAYGFGGAATVYGPGDPYRATLLGATDGALEALGTRASLGRLVEGGDLREGASPVVVLGYEYWRDKMGADPRLIGTSIKINQTMRQIVGVTAPGFRFRMTRPTELIFPMTFPPTSPGRRNGFTFVIGRLKPGHTFESAQTDLTRISKQLEQEFPQSNLASSYFALSLRDILVGSTRTALVLLLAAVGVVLLIACANVANLLLARSLTRRREMAVRMALGAGRGRLAAQLLSESLALAAVSGLLGMLIAYWGSRALVAMVPRSVEAPGLSEVHINASVLLFALGLTVVTTLVFGAMAMLTVRLDSPASVLVGGGRTSFNTAIRRAASGLVVAEVALAIVLLVGAGLVMRTFAGLLSVDPGFRYDHVMTMSISIPADRYRDSLTRDGFYRTAFAALRAVPGVTEVGTAAVTPLTGNNWTIPLERVEHPAAAGERAPEVGWQVASGGFFKALAIPLLSGRLFNDRDRPGGPVVVIVSQAIQKRFFPNENVLGKQIKLGNGTAEIVGVVGDIRRAGLRDEPRTDMYLPFELSPALQTTLFVRTQREPNGSLATLQSVIRSLESKTVFMESASLEDIAAESVRTTKLVLWLLGVFAATALTLAAIGIYGVMSYVVRQRTREIGTRIALGATRGNIVWLVMKQGTVIAALGAAAGLSIGFVAVRSLGSILYGVSPSDPITMEGATAVLVATILAACYVPARRAAAVDPARTLSETG